MRALALLAVGLAVGCGSALQRPDGSGGTGGTSGGAAGTTGIAGATGTAGSAGGVCIDDGGVHADGTEFRCGCALCFCRDGVLGVYIGGAACPTDGIDPCAIDAAFYKYGDIGGLAYTYETTLAPPLSYTHARVPPPNDAPLASCAPPLPACDSGPAIDVGWIMRHTVWDVDVQEALSMPTPPLYGYDGRAGDGTIFRFLRDDGRGFQVGWPCGGAANCVDAPLGIQRLVADLRALDRQQLMDPSCAGLH